MDGDVLVRQDGGQGGGVGEGGRGEHAPGGGLEAGLRSGASGPRGGAPRSPRLHGALDRRPERLQPVQGTKDGGPAPAEHGEAEDQADKEHEHGRPQEFLRDHDSSARRRRTRSLISASSSRSLESSPTSLRPKRGSMRYPS